MKKSSFYALIVLTPLWAFALGYFCAVQVGKVGKTAQGITSEPFFNVSPSLALEPTSTSLLVVQGGQGGDEISDGAGTGRGGNIIFSAGTSGKTLDGQKHIELGGSIIFVRADGIEALRIDPDGNVFVYGERVDTNKDVYKGWQSWMKSAGILGGN